LYLKILFEKSKLPVINLFEFAKRYEAGEPDYYIKEYVNKAAARIHLENEEPILNNEEFKNKNQPSLITTDNKPVLAAENPNRTRIDLNFGLTRNEVILNKDENNYNND
jgi:hypothetical protein